MNHTCVDSALQQLLYLDNPSQFTLRMKDQIDTLILELYFLKLYTQCLARRNCALLGKKNKHLGSASKCHIKPILGKAIKGLFSTGACALDRGEFEDWDKLFSQLIEQIQLCKPKIKKDCLDWLDCPLQCKFSSNEFRQFKETFSGFMDKLVRLKNVMRVDVKMQIEEIEGKLDLFSKIFNYHFWQMSSSNRDLNDFEIRIQAWTYNAACVSILYWVLDEKEYEMVTGKNFLPSDQLEIIMPFAPKVMGMYLAYLKCLRPSRHHQHPRRGEVVRQFVDFFLEIWKFVLQKDEIQNLRNSLMILVVFLMDPPLAEEYAEDVKLIDNGIESLICSLNTNKLKWGIAEVRSIFLIEIEKINVVETQVRKLNAHMILNSLSFNFPITNGLGFIESLLENLKKTSIHFANHQILIAYEELFSIRPCLKDMLELQNEHKELKDLWTQIVNTAHRVEIVVNSFLYMRRSVCCDIKWFSEITDEIKLIKGEVINILDQPMYKIQVPSTQMSSSLALPLQASTLIEDEIVVVLEDESKRIVDQLLGGSEQLEIISIVGMPGLGKTTLAKKVYSSPSIQYHFNKCAWCCVSQTYESKKLLLNVVHDVTRRNHDFSNMTCKKLEEELHKCLKGQRYLIVMDDIWDIGAWDALKVSLPDDNNGSRIVFTSRILDVSLHAKFHCSIHPHPLSYDESWQLLRKKLYDKDECPVNFTEIGQKIARKSKGLPLALVVIAGLLSKKVDHLDWWEQTEKNLDSRITSEGCMDILELSYKHLPEHLKPSFLYFGVFQEDSVIRVKKLTELWILEGFVQKSEVKNLEDVAKEYLVDLVQRSLVTVAETSSDGGIKTCHVHDLLHEFCKAIGKEENFSQLTSWNGHFSNSVGTIYKHYRMSIQSRGNEFFASYPAGPCVHSLLFTPHADMEYFSCGHFKILQVLDLEDAKFIGTFPEEITGLVLLRYLGLWHRTRTTIPPSIANLKHLETFRVKSYSSDDQPENEICCLPNTIWTMKRLRHVDIGRFTASLLADDVSEEISPLDNVQTVSSLSLSQANAEKILSRQPRVWKLRCQFHDHFSECHFLRELKLLNVQYVGNLLYPCGYNFPSTPKKLTLENFKLPWSEISTIGKLPNLEVLKLLADAFDGKEWDMEDEEFLNLKFLKFCRLNIKQWNASDYPFPCLQYLIVEECTELEEIPSKFGEIPSLKKIQVQNCCSTIYSSAKHIQEEQLDMGNEGLEVLIKFPQKTLVSLLEGFD